MNSKEQNEIILLRAMLKEYDDAEIIFKAKTFTASFKANQVGSLKYLLEKYLRELENKYVN